MADGFHRYDRQMELGLKTLDKDEGLLPENKALILKFHYYLVSTGLTNARLIKYVQVLRELSKILNKSFNDADKDDMIRVVHTIQERNYSVWTKQGYKVILKRFYKWLYDVKYFPDLVEWIDVRIKRTEKPLPRKSDLITREEVEKMMKASKTTRDRAFLAILYESACRIGEISTLRLRDLSFDKYGVVMTVKGKTGTRPIRVIDSTQYLMTWLESHPTPKDRDAPVWTQLNTKEIKIVRYSTMRKMILDTAEKAGIKKRIHPHLFRHSRATNLANELSNSQLEYYLGWVPGSKMTQTYVHLDGKDLDKALLNIHGLEEQTGEPEIQPKICPRCQHINPRTIQNCIRCASFLDQKAVFEQEEYEKKKRETDNKSQELLKTIIQEPKIQALVIERLRETGQLEALFKLGV